MFTRVAFAVVVTLLAVPVYAAGPSCTGAGPQNAAVSTPSHSVSAYGVQNATEVNFAVWSEVDGQDDLRWYAGGNQGGGTWNVDLDFASLRSSGTIRVHIYMNGGGVANVFCAPADFEYNPPVPTCTGVGTTSAAVQVPPVAAFAYGVERATVVNFAVWSEQNGQDDLRWYQGVNQGGGTWKSDLDFASLSNRGQIIIHVYMNGGARSNVFCGSTAFTYQFPKPSCTGVSVAYAAVDTPANAVFASGVTNASAVNFAIWSEDNGQDDLQWYAASNQGGGSWMSDVDFRRITGGGRIVVYAFMNGEGWLNVLCGSGGFTYNVGFAQPSCSGARPRKAVVDTPSNAVFAYGVKNTSIVNFAVWSERNGQDDLRWYRGIRQEDGSYRVDVDFGALKNSGQISVDVYLLRDGGANIYCGAAGFIYRAEAPSCTGVAPVEATLPPGTARFAVSALGVSGVRQVLFPVWSEANGQDDLRWYEGATADSGIWKHEIDLASHPGGAKIIYHVYLVGADGLVFCGGSFVLRSGG